MLNIVHFIARGVFKLLYFTRYRGVKYIPQGAAIFCANHTSNMDPLFILFREPIGKFPYSIGKAELFKKRPIAAFFRWVRVFPVRRGEPDLAAIKKALKVLKDGHKLIIFPEGQRVKDGSVDLTAKNGAALFAYKTGVPIVPVHLTARKKHPFRRVCVRYGEPIHLAFDDKKPSQEDYARVMEEVMVKIRALGME